MAFNVGPNDREVSLDVFGGLCTEMAASNLPLGVSPDCADVEFIPGSVISRRALVKQFASAFGAVSVNYEKSYVDNGGVIRNLFLDSAGNFWVENVSTAGTYTALLDNNGAQLTTKAGNYAKSVTAFGREYIAISDGKQGQDIPLQYDGTYVDRVTQDGPGAAPSVISFSIPSSTMAGGPGTSTYTITTVFPDQKINGFWTTLNVYTTVTPSAIVAGSNITLSGTAAGAYDGTYTVLSNPGPGGAFTVSAYFPGTSTSAAGGTVTYSTGTGTATMARAGNFVTVNTTTAHNLQVGYQAQITGVSAGTVGTSVSKIVINNENLPGIATVTTSAAHGLSPGIFVSITGVTAVTVGTAISAISRQGQVVTVTTSAAHGLSPGASVTISSVTNGSFNTTATVATVNSTTVFTFVQVDADATDSTGTVTINWPIPSTPTPTYFEVIACPTTTSFQIAISYSDSPAGGWTSGTVTYEWNGTFFVSSVISTTTFQYQQYGPDATTTDVGTISPFGAASPGIHQLQVAFLTRQGAITAPSPPVKFIAEGGQYISVTNVPIGPSNVVARILLFTGSNGSYFYYIPAPAQINGQIVSTSTVLNDNTTTSAILDFSDNTLYAALGASIQGNNLANQIVLDSALGFGQYASRLFTYGQRNVVQNLLNMGFDGGWLDTATTLPLGWTVTGSSGALATGRFGQGWNITVTAGAGNCGTLSQSMYQDAYSAPIAIAATLYKIRGWFKPSSAAADMTFTAKISSASTSFSTTATIAGNLMSTSGSWLEATFAAKTPSPIPSDLLLTIYASSSATSLTLLLDEFNIVYASNANFKNTYWSYVNNPEGMDGVSGLLGPASDPRPIFGTESIRDSLYLWSQDPSGHLHRTEDNGITEPKGWTITEVGSNCGLLSTFGLMISQADDSTGSGGEDWAAWASADGAMIFAGGTPEKISQEIQPDWATINSPSQTTIWTVNDYVNRVLYFGLPTGSATTPNRIYQMSYRQLNSAGAIAGSPPFRVGQGGKLVASDNTRKWAPWVLACNSAAMIYRRAGQLTMTFGGAQSHGNVYALGSANGTDDDYGQIFPYYTTAPFVGHDAEAVLQLGSHRKMLAYLSSFVSGVGNITISVLCDSLANAWPLTGVRPLLTAPKNDMEWTGGQALAQRMFIKFASTPATGTNNGFNLQHLVAVLRAAARLPVRGAPQS